MRKSAREQAIDKVIAKLQGDLSGINRKIISNKLTFKKLVDEQTVLKRERAELGQLIRDLTKKKGQASGKA